MGLRITRQPTVSGGGGTGSPGGTPGQIQVNDGAGGFAGLASSGTGNAVRVNAPTLVNPIVGTQSPGDNSTKAASTAYADGAIATALAGVVQVLHGEVEYFADLPSAAANSGKNYLVRKSSGTIFGTIGLGNVRRKGGIYTSDGAAWTLDGDATEAYFQDTLAWANITSKPSTFDTNATSVASVVHAATGKVTPADADELPLIDSAASNVLKKLTWANLKATAKAYFDTLYQAAGSYAAATHNHNASDINAGTLAAARMPALTGPISTSAGAVATTLAVDIELACSDNTTALATGTTKAYFVARYAMTFTDVAAHLLTAPVGSTLIVDINKNGVSIFSTRLTIDAGETDSSTAATPYAFTGAITLAAGDVVTIDIDQVGASTPGAGLLVSILATRS